MVELLQNPIFLSAGIAFLVTLALLPAHISRPAAPEEPEHHLKLLLGGTLLQAALSAAMATPALALVPTALPPVLTLALQAAMNGLWYLYLTACLWGEQRAWRSALWHMAVYGALWAIALAVGLVGDGLNGAAVLLPALGWATLLPLILGWALLLAKHDAQHPKDNLLLALAPLPLAAGSVELATAHLGIPVQLLFSLSLLVLLLYLTNHSGQKDALTGAYTRAWFKSNLAERIKSAGENPFVLLMLDLDHFKRINDTWGHLEGDNALVATVAVLRRSLRNSDLIARFAGDEFLVLASVGNANGGDIILKRMADQLGQYNMGSNKPYALSWSVGMIYCDRPQEADVLLGLADEQMYRRKKAKEKNEPAQLRASART